MSVNTSQTECKALQHSKTSRRDEQQTQPISVTNPGCFVVTWGQCRWPLFLTLPGYLKIPHAIPRHTSSKNLLAVLTFCYSLGRHIFQDLTICLANTRQPDSLLQRFGVIHQPFSPLWQTASWAMCLNTGESE